MDITLGMTIQEWEFSTSLLNEYDSESFYLDKNFEDRSRVNNLKIISKIAIAKLLA